MKPYVARLSDAVQVVAMVAPVKEYYGKQVNPDYTIYMAKCLQVVQALWAGWSHACQESTAS